MRNIGTLFFALLFCSLLMASENIIELEAESGMFDIKEIGDIADGIEVTFSLSSFEVNRSWPASAYVGISEGYDQNNSFQVLIIQNKPSDKFIVGGYRIIKNGEEILAKSLFKKELSEQTNVKLEFLGGVVVLAIDGANEIKIQTHLVNVVPYVSVASGKARFKIDT